MAVTRPKAPILSLNTSKPIPMVSLMASCRHLPPRAMPGSADPADCAEAALGMSSWRPRQLVVVVASWRWRGGDERQLGARGWSLGGSTAAWRELDRTSAAVDVGAATSEKTEFLSSQRAYASSGLDRQMAASRSVQRNRVRPPQAVWFCHGTERLRPCWGDSMRRRDLASRHPCRPAPALVVFLRHWTPWLLINCTSSAPRLHLVVCDWRDQTPDGDHCIPIRGPEANPDFPSSLGQHASE